MNELSYEKLKKEVISEITGSSVLDRFRERTPYRFKIAYYDKIADKQKKEMLRHILLDMLEGAEFRTKDKLRCFVAYIASDIGLSEAKPFVENMASEEALFDSCLLLLVERALANFDLPYRFSYEQIKRIIVCLMGEKYVPWYFQGEFPYSFNEYYYSGAIPNDKKVLIQQVLMDILGNPLSYSLRQRCVSAYFASDIGLNEAKPIIEKMADEKAIKKDTAYSRLIEHALRNFSELSKVKSEAL